MTRKIEVRCPVGPHRLFAKLVLNPQSLRITDGNLIEFACADCRKRSSDNSRVLHRFDITGELVETVLEVV